MIILLRKLHCVEMDSVKIKKTFEKNQKYFSKICYYIYIFMKILFSPIKDRIKQKYVFVKFFLKIIVILFSGKS